MAEIRVADWRLSLAWYRDTLGLRPALEDPARGFALLDALPGRIALKQAEDEEGRRPSIRLVFEVDDLEATRARLIRLGLAAGEPRDHADEGFREIRLEDPDGTPITLFAWHPSEGRT